jgi:hypothetical protein
VRRMMEFLLHVDQLLPKMTFADIIRFQNAFNEKMDLFVNTHIQNKVISEIRDEAFQKVGYTGNAPNEVIVHPLNSAFTKDQEQTMTIDSWLVDDELLEDMENSGNIQKNYCFSCHSSFSIKEKDIITHSLSQRDIRVLLQMLPSTRNMSLVDVGSRLGSLLYSAYFFTDCKKIIGIEKNGFFCEMQNDFIRKHNLSDRILICEGDVRNFLNVLCTADILIFNNVFEFFNNKLEMKDIWTKILTDVCRHPGKLLLCTPPLDIVFERSNIVFENNFLNLLETLKIFDECADFDFSAALYRVL